MKSRLLKLLFVLVFIAVCVLPGGVLTNNVHAATTYYLSTTGNDNNTGSEANPWKTLYKASNSMAAGDTLLIKPGTYYGQGYSDSGQSDWTLSGTSAAPILIAAADMNNKPIFDGSQPRTRDGLELGSLFALTTQSYITIRGLEITNYGDEWGNGVIVISQTGNHITIENCYIHGNGTDHQDHCIYLAGGTDTTHVVNNITIRNNILADDPGGGVHIYHYPAAQHVDVYNNSIVNCNWGVVAFGNSLSDLEIYNNSFYNNKHSVSFWPDDAQTSMSGVVIKNNVSYSPTSWNGNTNCYGLYVTSPFTTAGIITEDYNDWYSAENTPIYWGSTVYSNIATYRTASPGTNGDHSTFANPLYTSTGSPYDFPIASNSPAKDTGTTIALVTTDRVGTSRPQGTAYDMGAYEIVVATPTPTPTPTPSLPSEWSSGDIGSCTPAGSSSYSAGTFTIAGSGADVWGTADAFQFCKSSKSGDCTVIARVTSQTNTHAGAKAGCMIRETLNANSSNAFVTVTPENGVTFQVRTSTGGTTTTTIVSGITVPIWLKLVRSGNNFSGYYSSNGTSWTQIGTTQSITMTSSVYSGLAVTSRINALCTAQFDNVQNGLPSGWSSGDIGSCTPAGSSSYSAGTFTIAGSGADVWDTSDAFQFCESSKSGDCTVIARVTSQTNTHAGAKAGCMIRETLNANSANAFVTVTPVNGVTFQVRTSTGGTTTTTIVSGITVPIWLKLVRSGNNFSGYYSSNGTSWTQIGTTQSITMASSVYSGLAVTSHTDGTLCTAQFDNVQNGLPSGWSSGDIGSCTPAGSTSYSAGTFTISGSGADVWGTADAFQFSKSSKSGDCTVIARVTSQTNTHAGAKAGCMIRETLNANSSNAFVTVTPVNGVTFQVRTSTGGTTTTTIVSGITVPIWLKLVRSGNNFSGYYSSNGTSWTQIGTTQSITMTSSVYSGLAVTSHNDGTLSTATFTDVSN